MTAYIRAMGLGKLQEVAQKKSCCIYSLTWWTISSENSPKNSKTSTSPPKLCLTWSPSGVQLFVTAKLVFPCQNYHIFPIATKTLCVQLHSQTRLKKARWYPFCAVTGLCLRYTNTTFAYVVFYCISINKGMVIPNWGLELARDFSICFQLRQLYEHDLFSNIIWRYFLQP
jgi:hypothetical protein